MFLIWSYLHCDAIYSDERYQEERNLLHISKWLKNSIKHYGSFQETMNKLESFFQNAEVLILLPICFSKFGRTV